jgi:hypothetical protein
MDNLWYVTLAEARDKLLNCENYGYGRDLSLIKKGLPVIQETVERHKSSYQFWMELYCYKLLRDEGRHWPVRVMEPRWEMEIALDWWTAYFSYSWQGAKTDRIPLKEGKDG